MEIIIKLNGLYYSGMKEVDMRDGGLGLGGFGYTGTNAKKGIPTFTKDIEKAEVTWTPIDLSRKIKNITDAIKYKDIDMKFDKMELINTGEK